MLRGFAEGRIAAQMRVGCETVECSASARGPMLSHGPHDKLEGELQTILDFLEVSWSFSKCGMVALGDAPVAALTCIHALLPNVWKFHFTDFDINYRARLRLTGGWGANEISFRRSNA